VKLSDITTPEKLEEGKTYPIDIFFCDSRSTMSNISIRSNIYFAQKPVNGREPGLYKQKVAIGDEICLQESAASCTALRNGGNVAPICGEALAPKLSYKLAVPGWGEVQLNESNNKCIWVSPTYGVCYGGIMLNNGVVNVVASAVAEAEGGYLAEHGFDLYAMVPGYASLNVSKTTQIIPSSSSGNASSSSAVVVSSSSSIPPGMVYCQIANTCSLAPIETCQAFGGTEVPSCETPIRSQTVNPRYTASAPQYYNLKGEPLGSKKPTKAGVYIVRQNGANKIVTILY